MTQKIPHLYWITTTDPHVMDCIRRIHIPGRVLMAEQAKHGIEAMFCVEYIGAPDKDYEFLVTLDALLAKGARVSGVLPARKTPPDDN